MIKITSNKLIYFGKVKDLLLYLNNNSYNYTLKEFINDHSINN